VRDDHSILILGNQASALAPLADRIRRLGFHAVRAKTFDDAVELAEERGFRFAVSLLEPDVPVVDLERALVGLRDRTRNPDMVFVATGARPGRSECAHLRQAGVELALWQPIGDHPLLFQLNRARARALGQAPALRDTARAPTEWSTRLYVGGRAKRAEIYSLSAGGAFLATARPSPRGARLELDLPLPKRPLRVVGQVLYTNVPGNLQRECLPNGMAVRFIDAPEREHRAIGESVSETAARYFV